VLGPQRSIKRCPSLKILSTMHRSGTLPDIYHQILDPGIRRTLLSNCFRI
jgi:hypothetical protein